MEFILRISILASPLFGTSSLLKETVFDKYQNILGLSSESEAINSSVSRVKMVGRILDHLP